MLQHAEAERVRLFGVHSGQLALQAVALLKHQIFAQHDAHQRADRVEGLADVEAQRGAIAVANHRAIGIGGGFQKAQADGDSENGREEHGIGGHMRGGIEQHAAADIERQPHQDRQLIARSADHQRGRNGNEKVAAVKGALHQRAGEVAERKNAFELGDQDVVQARGAAPQREEAREQNELEQRRFI